jgi:hypothetical protein
MIAGSAVLCSHNGEQQKSKRPKQLRAAFLTCFTAGPENRVDLVRDDDEAWAVNVYGWLRGTRRRPKPAAGVSDSAPDLLLIYNRFYP